MLVEGILGRSLATNHSGSSIKDEFYVYYKRQT